MSFDPSGGAKVTIRNSTIAAGTAESGGGIAIVDGTTLDLIGSTVTGNRATGDGGGIRASSGALLTVRDSTISNNTADDEGGGIIAANFGTSLFNTTLSGNHAGNTGGAIDIKYSVALTNVTISGNSAGSTGGGISQGDVQFYMKNSIVSGNKAASGSQDIDSLFFGDGGNIVGGTLSDIFANVVSVDPDGPGGLTAFLAGQLADNGGPVQTIALAPFIDNPALDRSDSSAPATDARGVARGDVPGVNNVNGSAADIGALEVRILNGTADADSFTATAGPTIGFGLGANDTMTFNFRLADATVTYVGNFVIIKQGTSISALQGFETFVFTDGTVNNADDNPLVDDLFYYSRNLDVWASGASAEDHFSQFGRFEDRDPNAFFDISFYLAINQDVKAAGVDPLAHFEEFGWKEGRVPSADFDPAAYLTANPDVEAAGLNPLSHFLQFGAAEGRQAPETTELLTSNGFDYIFYLANNPDVAAAGVDPFAHFQNIGWKEGRMPNEFFDTAGYLANYEDVRNAGVNPLDHYNIFGWKEGRDPSTAFDTTDYLDANPDVKAAGINPLSHFLDFGRHEGRVASNDGIWA